MDRAFNKKVNWLFRGAFSFYFLFFLRLFLLFFFLLKTVYLYKYNAELLTFKY